MLGMTFKAPLKAVLVAALSFLFLVPSLSFAATTTTQTTAQQALIQRLTLEIVQLQAQLDALLAASPILTSTSTPIAFVSIPVATHVDQIDGGLRITFLGFEKLQTSGTIAPTSPLAQTLGSFLLDYSVCPTTFCSSPAYPTMHAELWPGQSTVYMNQKIILNGFSTTSPSALLIVTPAS